MKKYSLAEEAKAKVEEKAEASVPQAKEAAVRTIRRDEMAESWNARATMGLARAPITFAEIALTKKEVQRDHHRCTMATTPTLTTYPKSG